MISTGIVSMRNSTQRCRRRIVSTQKKSHARIPCAYAQKLTPGRLVPSRRRRQAGPQEHASDTRRRDAHANLGEPARDSLMASTRVLACEPKNQRARLRTDRRAVVEAFPGLPSGLLEACIAELEPNTAVSLSTQTHAGEEFVYVLVRTVELTVLEEVMVLSPEDAAHVRGTTAHQLPPGAGRLTLLAVQGSGGTDVSAVEMDGDDRG